MPRKQDEYARTLETVNSLGMNIDLMRPLSPFALRLPHPIKDAAKALSESRFYESDEAGQVTKKAWGGGSINDVLNSLLMEGLKNCQPILLDAIQRLKAERSPFAKMAAFLIGEPDASGVTAGDFPKDAQVADFLRQVHAECELPVGAPTWKRAELMQELSRIDGQLQRLNEARALVAIALEPKTK